MTAIKRTSPSPFKQEEITDMVPDSNDGMSRRTVLIFSGAAAATAFLAACTDGATQGSSAVISAASAKYKGKVIISLTGTVPKAAQTAIAAAYKKVQPGVDVVWELPGSDNYVSWLETQLASGQIRPDVVSGFVNSKDYVDFQAWESRPNPYTHDSWDKDLTFKGNLDANGKLIFIGTRSVTVPIIYNKDQFAKAGISTLPDTWDELVTACQKLRASGATPFSANFTLHAAQWMREVYFDQYHTDWVKTVQAQKGDWDFDPTKDGTFKFDAQDPNLHDKYNFNLQRYYAGIRGKTLRFDTDQVAAFIQNMAKVFPTYAQADFVLPNDPYPGFLAQKGAMMANTPGALISLKKDQQKNGTNFGVAYFPFPRMTGPLVTTTKSRAVESITGDYISVINKNTQQAKMVMDFMMFWLSKAGYGTYLNGAATDPTWAGPDGPLLVQGVQDPAPYTDAFAGLPSRGNAEASYNTLFLNWGNGNGNFRKESQQIYLKALQGKITPQSAASQIQDYVQKNFSDILKAHQLTGADLDNPARQPGS